MHFQGQIHSEMQNWGAASRILRSACGQKISYVKSPLKKRRAKVVEKVCRQMTGGDEETELKQYAKVYKRMSTTKKDKLFHLTGCTKKSW